MMGNIYFWLKDVLEKEYRIVRNIKNENGCIINVMEKTGSNIRVLVKYIAGNGEVYKELINIYHKNLPIVYEAVSDGENSIIIEEYIDGVTVGDILETGLYTSKGIYKVISEVCEALKVLHGKGIIHRDIKPENIIITDMGGVKLIDFNISRINSSNKNRDTIILGTTGFAAPEQYGISETDERSDIYAIGILINVMLTGEHPAKKLCDGKWKKIVNKCTRINPEERFQNVEELMHSITNLRR